VYISSILRLMYVVYSIDWTPEELGFISLKLRRLFPRRCTRNSSVVHRASYRVAKELTR
jgi:hypothetical protein